MSVEKAKSLTRSEQKRLAIVNAAKSAFRTFGVDATSMDKIAELAQVSKRTVYNHFKSKESLVMYLLNALWDEALVNSQPTFDAEASIDEQLRALLLEETQLLADGDYIDLARVAIGYFLFQPEVVQNELLGFTPEETALYKWLQEQTASKQINCSDVASAFTQLHSLIKGACFWPQLIHSKEVLSKQERRELANSTAEMFLARYKA